MKLQTLWTLLLLSLMICLGATAKTTTRKPMKPATSAQLKTFNILLEQEKRAVLRRDAHFMRSRLAPNFLIRYSHGIVMNRAQHIRYTAALYKRIVKINSAFSQIKRLGFREKQAFVATVSTIVFTMRDRTGKLRLIKTSSHMDSIWIQSGHSWLAQSAIQNWSRTFVDGHEVLIRPKSKVR